MRSIPKMILSACFICLSLLSQSAVAGNDEPRRPNIIFILADDLGWSDTTLFGTTQLYQTPNIQRLAQRGMTFTRAYSASPLCSPTRAAILTGLNPCRLGLTAPNCHLPQVILKATPSPSGDPSLHAAAVNSVTRLSTTYPTLAKTLKKVGYRTAHFGKWHLGKEPYSPLEHGFDVDVPHWHGPGPAGSYVAPWTFPDFDPDTPNEHIEDRMAQDAVEFMTENKDRPFFLNYWMFSVHAPFDAKAALIEKYRSRIDSKDGQRSPTYAAMVESMDDAVGTLLDAVDQLGIAQNTIIIFASDNGGNMYNSIDGTTPTDNRPLRGGKATMFEGGVRVPCSVIWPGQVEANSRSAETIQSCDYFPSILEMIGLEPEPSQQFDGISILPALRGGSLNRKAIFTYFPHSPGVPDWLPPSVSVHAGDWKLIRLFHAGTNGHRYKLFDLSKDIGEKQDLAAELPAKVEELDALIEEFLQDTKAVVPVKNKQFDPAKFDLAAEGVSKMKAKGPKRGAGGQGKSKRDPSKVKPVAGWLGLGTSTLAIQGETLVMTSDGNDPYMSFDLKKPVPPGAYTLRITMAAKAKDRGQVFWAHPSSRPKHSAQRATWFEVKHDNQQRQHDVWIEVKKPISGFRIDPARGPGKITFASIELFDEDGDSVRRWTFK